jgi:hypothetical protein
LRTIAPGFCEKFTFGAALWLEEEDIQACLLYARRLVGRERVEPFVLETTSG